MTWQLPRCHHLQFFGECIIRFQLQFHFSTPKKVLWKLANALLAANKCSKSLGLNILRRLTMFSLAILVHVLSPSQSTAHCCDRSGRAKVRNNVQIHSSPHKLTSHNHKLPTFSAFWFEIIKTSCRFEL